MKKSFLLPGLLLLPLLAGCGAPPSADVLELNADLLVTSGHVVVKNGDRFVWRDVTVTVNEEYVYRSPLVPRGGTSLPFAQFVAADGNAFQGPLRSVQVHVGDASDGKAGIFNW